MTVLDWRDPSHWGSGTADRRARCRLCGGPTFLRDDAGRAAHKVCVECAIDAITTTRKDRSS